MSLAVATKANQALIVPLLIIAEYINQRAEKPVISVTYKDGDTVEASDKPAIATYTSTGATLDQVGVAELVKAHPDLSRARDVTLVG